MIFVSVLDGYRFDISGITKQAHPGWAHSLVQFSDYLDSNLEAIRLNNRFCGDYLMDVQIILFLIPSLTPKCKTKSLFVNEMRDIRGKVVEGMNVWRKKLQYISLHQQRNILLSKKRPDTYSFRNYCHVSDFEKKDKKHCNRSQSINSEIHCLLMS